MAVTFRTAVVSTPVNDTDSSVALTVVTATARALVVGVAMRFDEFVDNVASDLDGAFEQIGRQANGTAGSVELWGLRAPTVGEHSITVTCDSFARHAFCAVQADGVLASGTWYRTAAGDAESGSVTSVSVDATSQADDAVVDVVHFKGPAGPISVGDGGTQLGQALGDDDSNAPILGMGYEIAGGTSTTRAWSRTGSDQAVILAAALVPEPGGGSSGLTAGQRLAMGLA